MIARLLREPFDLIQTGVSTDDSAPKAASIMLASASLFLVIGVGWAAGPPFLGHAPHPCPFRFVGAPLSLVCCFVLFPCTSRQPASCSRQHPSSSSLGWVGRPGAPSFACYFRHGPHPRPFCLVGARCPACVTPMLKTHTHAALASPHACHACLQIPSVLALHHLRWLLALASLISFAAFATYCVHQVGCRPWWHWEGGAWPSGAGGCGASAPVK